LFLWARSGQDRLCPCKDAWGFCGISNGEDFVQADWDTFASPSLAGRILRVAALVDGNMLAKMLKVHRD
jgi:hypothetical protein